MFHIYSVFLAYCVIKYDNDRPSQLFCATKLQFFQESKYPLNIGCQKNWSTVMFLSEILKSSPISLRLATMEFGVIQVCWLLDRPQPENSVNMKIFDDIITILTVVYMADHLIGRQLQTWTEKIDFTWLATFNFSWHRITDKTVNLEQRYTPVVSKFSQMYNISM